MSSRYNEQYCINILNDLENLAEPAFKEFQTTKYIQKQLEKCGITDFISYETGGFGTLDFGAKKTIALRADIDALPINKDNTKFKHLCGHHLHASSLLMTLCRLAESGKKPNVNIRYIFQPAEEIVQGANFLISKGVLDNVDEIYGMHVDPELEMGTFSIKKGQVMAGARHLKIVFEGKATHAAYPHLGNDIIVAASDFITRAQIIISRKIDPSKKGVISFGRIAGGSVGNILPDHLEVDGTFRYFEEANFQLIKSEMFKLIRSIEIFYDIKITFDIFDGPPPLINKPDVVSDLTNRLNNCKTKQVDDHRVSMGGEDFAFYLKQVSGCFIRTGIKFDDKIIPLHAKNFKVQQSVLSYAINIWESLIYSY